MRGRIAFVLAVAAVVHATTARAESSTMAQLEIKVLIKKLYSYDPDYFEMGNIDGKFQPNRQCDLFREFFEERMIVKKDNGVGCELGRDLMGFLRFPTASSEDLSSTRRGELPKEKIDTPVVIGESAKVSVVIDVVGEGRSLYFLRRTDRGWRISNAMIHEKWPDLDDKVNNCYYRFALSPSEEERKEILPHCR